MRLLLDWLKQVDAPLIGFYRDSIMVEGAITLSVMARQPPW